MPLIEIETRAHVDSDYLVTVLKEDFDLDYVIDVWDGDWGDDIVESFTDSILDMMNSDDRKLAIRKILDYIGREHIANWLMGNKDA